MVTGLGFRRYLLCILFLLSITIFCVSARNSISLSGNEMEMLQVSPEDYGEPSANNNHYPGRGRFDGGGRGRGRGRNNWP
nr:protein PSY1-like [Nicotiana tomentosiformis]